MKRGQVSVEYIIIVGFVVFAITATVGVIIYYNVNARDQIRLNQLGQFAEKVVGSSESVFFAGEPSKATINVFLPKGVRSIDIIENSLVFDIKTESGISTIAFASNVPIDFTLSGISTSQGLKSIEIYADDDVVYIGES
jgi:uncharacterized protein (UPF0333 family)